MVTAALRDLVAQRIGPYEVLLDIGSGGMGTITLARATGDPVGVGGFARLVAIKRPLGALAADPEVMQGFLDEARLLAQIHHANVVGIHQIGSDAGGHFLVLDYIEGGTLDELLTRSILHRKKLPPPVVLRILGDVLAGLHAVHEAADVEGRPLQMLHRDVSAQNVLVGKDGVSRIADFGIAKAIVSSIVTDKAYLQGRIPYIAPEYLRRESVDRRLDVYAAGVTMWTALAGRLPWGDAADAQIVRHIVHDGVPGLSNAGVTIPPAIEEIVARACARDPAVRYASAQEMLAAIDSLGRRTGWIASHAEVATIVEELLGLEIRARRTAIARRLAPPAGRPASDDRGLAPASTRDVRAPLPIDESPSISRGSTPPADGAGAGDDGPSGRASMPSGPSTTFTPSARSLLTEGAGSGSPSALSSRSRARWIALALAVAVVGALLWRWGPSTPSLAGPVLTGPQAAALPDRPSAAVPPEVVPPPSVSTSTATSTDKPAATLPSPGLPVSSGLPVTPAPSSTFRLPISRPVSSVPSHR